MRTIAYVSSLQLNPGFRATLEGDRISLDVIPASVHRVLHNTLPFEEGLSFANIPIVAYHRFPHELCCVVRVPDAVLERSPVTFDEISNCSPGDGAITTNEVSAMGVCERNREVL